MVKGGKYANILWKTFYGKYLYVDLNTKRYEVRGLPYVLKLYGGGKGIGTYLYTS